MYIYKRGGGGVVEKLQGDCLWGGLVKIEMERRPTFALDNKFFFKKLKFL